MIDRNELRKFLIKIKNVATEKVSPLSFSEIEKIIIDLNISEEIIEESIPILKKGHFLTQQCIDVLEGGEKIETKILTESENEVEKEIVSNVSSIDPIKKFMNENRELILEIRNHFSKNEIFLVKQINWKNFIEKNNKKIDFHKQEILIRIFKDLGIFSKNVNPHLIEDEDVKIKTENIILNSDEIVFKYKKIISALIKYKNAKEKTTLTKSEVIKQLYKINSIANTKIVEDEDFDGFINILEEQGIVSEEAQIDLDDINYDHLDDVLFYVKNNLMIINNEFGSVDEEDVLSNTLNYHDEIVEAKIDFSTVLNLIKEDAIKDFNFSKKKISDIEALIKIMHYLEIKVVTLSEVIDLLKNYSFNGKERVFKEPSFRRLLNSHSLETFGNEKSYSNKDTRYFWKPSPSTYELIDIETLTNNTINMTDKEKEEYIKWLIEDIRPW